MRAEILAYWGSPTGSLGSRWGGSAEVYTDILTCATPAPSSSGGLAYPLAQLLPQPPVEKSDNQDSRVVMILGGQEVLNSLCPLRPGTGLLWDFMPGLRVTEGRDQSCSPVFFMFYFVSSFEKKAKVSQSRGD